MTNESTAPLDGVRVVVTRAKAQASTLVETLRSLGADPIEVATIEVKGPADGGQALAAAAGRLGEYDWVVLTSTNAVERYVAAAQGRTSYVRHAVVGSSTLAALEASWISADLVPPRFVAESLVEAFERCGSDSEGQCRVLFPSAAETAPTIVEGLSAKGWHVDQVVAYETIGATVSDTQREVVGEADAVLFTSGSSVDRFCELVGKDRLPGLVVCIGPTTAMRAEGHGIDVSVVADPHTIDGLVAALQGIWVER